MEKKKCEHKSRKNLKSNQGPGYNFVEVICLDCGMTRYETRNTKDSSVTTGKWFKPRENGKR